MIVITGFKKSLIFCCKNEPIKTFQVCELREELLPKTEKMDLENIVFPIYERGFMFV